MPTIQELEQRRQRIEYLAKAYPKKRGTDQPLDNQLNIIMKGNPAGGIAAISSGEIQNHANNTYPITDPKTIKLAEDFLNYKKQNGSAIEKELYSNMSVNDFITRLLTNRPLMFIAATDQYILRDGTKGMGGFEAIGTPNQRSPLVLANYISYEEMEISALLGVSSPTHFINSGKRENNGIATPDADHQTQGIYVGQVGARFERPEQMEWKYMMVTPEQNTSQNGYGKKSKSKPQLAHWKAYYGVDHFSSYDEATKDKSRFLEIPQGAGKAPHYLDKEIYRKYIQAKIESFLGDANQRGKEAGKKAYVHAVGLGTGVWAVNTAEQEKIMIEAYRDVLRNNEFSYIADVNFSWFSDANRALATGTINNIQLHFSKRNPADILTGPNEGKLLVAQYAWDGNSKPGNEYYANALSASGDPAAACCSTIAVLQDAETNKENVNGNNLRLVNAQQHKVVARQTKLAEKSAAETPSQISTRQNETLSNAFSQQQLINAGKVLSKMFEGSKVRIENNTILIETIVTLERQPYGYNAAAELVAESLESMGVIKANIVGTYRGMEQTGGNRVMVFANICNPVDLTRLIANVEAQQNAQQNPRASSPTTVRATQASFTQEQLQNAREALKISFKGSDVQTKNNTINIETVVTLDKPPFNYEVAAEQVKQLLAKMNVINPSITATYRGMEESGGNKVKVYVNITNPLDVNELIKHLEAQQKTQVNVNDTPARPKIQRRNAVSTLNATISETNSINKSPTQQIAIILDVDDIKKIQTMLQIINPSAQINDKDDLINAFANVAPLAGVSFPTENIKAQQTGGQFRIVLPKEQLAALDKMLGKQLVKHVPQPDAKKISNPEPASHKPGN